MYFLEAIFIFLFFFINYTICPLGGEARPQQNMNPPLMPKTLYKTME